MRRPVLATVLAIIVFVLAAGAVTQDDATRNWPSFRGPLQTGVAPHGDPPVEWSETKNLRFKVELPGPGHASPVVWGDRIYVLSAVRTNKSVAPAAPPSAGTEADADASGAAMPATFQQAPDRPAQEPRGKRPSRRGGQPPREKPTHTHRFVVSAFERESGDLLWETVVREEVPHEPGHPTASQASASPVTDGEHVWAFFGSRGLYCLDNNGKVRWEVDLGEMSTRNEFGEGASPVVHGDTIVVNWDHEGDSFIVALDKRTGEQRWRVPRDEPTSWTTPLVVRDGQRELVVVSGATRVRAYDLKTGNEVWNCGGLGLNCIPTPVADGELVFVMSGWREAAALAIRYGGAKGDLTDSEAVAWRADRGLSYVPSPLLYDGKLYFFQRFSGLLSCRELASGEACYEQQRIDGLDNIYASPVGAAGRIYAVSRDGKTVVFRHGKKFEVLATNTLEDSFNATPAIVGDTLFLRGERYLYALAEG